MGHSQAEKAESRERIVEAAARQIRKGGIDSLSIAELMKQAKLTHGGFYGHFPSRTALIEAAVERALDHSARSFAAARPSSSKDKLTAFVNTYLSPGHRDHPEGGCAFAALAADVGRCEGPEIRRLMSERLDKAASRISELIGGGPDTDAVALGIWSTMVGAIALSRITEGPQSDEILKAARRSVLDAAARLRGPANDPDTRTNS